MATAGVIIRRKIKQLKCGAVLKPWGGALDMSVRWFVHNKQLYNYHTTCLSGLAFLLPFILAASPAMCGEWVNRSDNLVVGVVQDGAGLVVQCHPPFDLSFLFDEPRANWQEGAKMEVVTRPDKGMRFGRFGADSLSEYSLSGTVVNPTIVTIKGLDVTGELWIMGQSRTSFTISVGGYTRTFPSANLRKAVEPVLDACGMKVVTNSDGWDIESKEPVPTQPLPPRP